MIKHSSPISGIATYRDRYVATAGYDNRVILWDAKTHTVLNCGVHDHLVNQCLFSPNGDYLLTSSSDYTARLWSVPELKLLAVCPQHQDDVEGLAFHPEDAIFATASRDHQIRLFNYSGQLLQTLTGHTRDVLSIIWITSDMLISSGDDGTVKCWDTGSGQLMTDIDMQGVETDTISVSSQGTIFAGNDAGEIICINKGRRLVINAHKSGIKKLCFNQEKSLLVSLSYDRSVKLWQVYENHVKAMGSTYLPSIVWARSADFLGDNEIVFATFGDRYARYNYQRDEWYINDIGVTYGKNAVCIHQNHVYSIGDAGILWQDDIYHRRLPSLCNFLISVGDFLLTGGQTGELFNALTGDVIYQHGSPLNCASSFIKDNLLHIIVGSYTGDGIVFIKKHDHILYQNTIHLHDNAVKSIACSSDMIYSVCATGAGSYHQVSDFELVMTIKNLHDKIANACVHLHGDIFASVSRDLTMRLVGLQSKERVDTPHKNSIKCMTVSTDKQFIATGDYRGQISIYDLHNNSWYSTRPTTSGISSLIYDVHTKNFIASSYDSFLYKIALADIKFVSRISTDE